MTGLQIILLISALIFAVLSLRSGMIAAFKIGYYEQKLKDRGVDISEVKNITVWKIYKL